MQEIPNAPWDNNGDGEGMTRDDYINFVKEVERKEEEAMIEPPPLYEPLRMEIGIQVDPPPIHVGTSMTPPDSEKYRDSEYAQEPPA